MRPTEDWIKEWRYGVNPHLEREVSEGLLEIFKEFWDRADIDAKSKSTKQRYAAALHALGGYLIEQIGNEAKAASTVREFLAGYIYPGEGPLIHHDNEAWQNELDTVCRKLYKYLTKMCLQGQATGRQKAAPLLAALCGFTSRLVTRNVTGYVTVYDSELQTQRVTTILPKRKDFRNPD